MGDWLGFHEWLDDGGHIVNRKAYSSKEQHREGDVSANPACALRVFFDSGDNETECHYCKYAKDAELVFD
jgi:primosomal protein N'